MSNKDNQLKNANKNYQKAIELTTKVINRRALNYRNLVIIVTVICLVTIVWAIIQLSWKPLLSFSMLLPICGSFLLIDSMEVNKWQKKILTTWSEQQFELNIFRQLITSIKTLPVNTVKSLVQTIIPGHSRKDELTRATRKAIITTIHMLNNCQNSYMINMIIIGSIILSSFALALVYWLWQPLLGLFIILPFWGIGKWSHSFRLNRLKKEISRMCADNNFELESFLVYFDSLDWSQTVLRQKNKLLEYFNDLKR